MGSTSERTAYHHGNLREALIAASLDLLEREGCAGLGLRAAARAAGVSQTAPYHHFGGKEGLLAAVAAHGFRLMRAEQDRIATAAREADLDPEALVHELGVGYVRMARRHPELFRLMFGTAIVDRDAHPELVEANQDAYSVIADATRELLIWRNGAAGPEDVSIAVTAAWATVHGLANLLIDGRLRPGENDVPEEGVLVRRVLETFSLSVGRHIRPGTS